MTAAWQQIFALDARYNANRAPNHPNFRTLYIRRRNQLLKEAFQGDDTSFRKQYLKIRSFLLQQRYGNTGAIGSTYDQISVRSRSVRSVSRDIGVHVSCMIKLKGSYKHRMQDMAFVDISLHEETADQISDTNDSIPRHLAVSENVPSSLVPTKQAEASRAIVGGTSISENYAFVGVHHIFDQHSASVTVVKFANNDRARLCCASRDGTVSICNVTNDPPSVEMILRDHEKAVTSCDWSLSNDLVVSCSLDCTVRLWNAHSGKCLRVVRDQTSAEVLACVFQPANNNMVIAGNAKGVLSVLNVSTGIYLKGGSSKIGGKVMSIACDSTGLQVWAGTDKGLIMSYQFVPGTGKLHKRKKMLIAENCPVTCLSWRAWISREARDPTLLVNCAADVVCLYRVTDAEGNLQLKRKFSIRHKSELIRSTFCPIMSFRQGACIVTGSEDSCVYFLDIEKDDRPVVNKLQGHACPVLGVSFNYDESLLATSDLQGLIIIWKRAI